MSSFVIAVVGAAMFVIATAARETIKQEYPVWSAALARIVVGLASRVHPRRREEWTGDISFLQAPDNPGRSNGLWEAFRYLLGSPKLSLLQLGHDFKSIDPFLRFVFRSTRSRLELRALQAKTAEFVALVRNSEESKPRLANYEEVGTGVAKLRETFATMNRMTDRFEKTHNQEAAAFERALEFNPSSKWMRAGTAKTMRKMIVGNREITASLGEAFKGSLEPAVQILSRLQEPARVERPDPDE